ncbi:valine--tRNA ligase, mitochondrial 1-like [Panicum miliaceum]|uniref:Valine--tRNA ligase, mitochondrial n=1 Tax=Panicum miliaceum TaxID=4540 RepID=A0A3L6TEK4_PANMI|nr:valine--tRNA ligase, mitochondrial 1-like [Panicum miliaceum]
MEKPLDAKELERKLKKDQKAREKEEKKIKAKQKEAARLQAQAVSDGGGAKKSDKKLRKKGATDESSEDFIDPETPAGQKKLLASQMAKQYSPAAVEKSWCAWWESSRYFEADAASSKPPFVIVQPPPNVTGVLHIGHAITAAIEDAIIRRRRMSGYNALWVPGMDHAGIATQVVVEKKLMREKNLSRHDVGREKFLCEVLKWKEQHGGAILKQLRILGASLDWSRECFTMDELRSKAVTEAFVRLYKDGLIYRAHRLVNWDCTLRTAISDIEVDHEDLAGETPLEVPGYKSPVQFGVLISFAYPLEEGLGEIIVATTRIETMLGDTAIAVHPQDGRYKHLHGKYAVHPFNGRKLKIICDAELVDPNFGTGAVKITPAHDPNDFKVGERHNLEFINIFTDDGKINEMGGSQFEGMPRFSARTAVIDALKNKGLYHGTKSNVMSLSLCSRSKDVKEPMMKPQWFVSCNSMAKGALDAVKSKKIEIIPPQYEQDWYRWLENIRDWCISRQLWWGHRIPAWYVTLEDDEEKDMGSYSDHWIIARDENDAILEAKQRYPGKKYQLYQDPDVLDTWFSSGLFPLSVLGWPDDKPDLSTFYPSSVLETGSDILFFWVARMVMMGMQLGGDVPFQKSDKINLDIKRVHGYRQWCNKLWNAIRFAMNKLGDRYVPPATIAVCSLPPVCKWILSVLNKAVGKTESSLEAYKFSEATSSIYSWWQYQLCDVYIEAIKPYFNESQEFESARGASRDTLWVCLDMGLRLLHPFMPYITEELWQRLPQPKEACTKDSIMISEYPTVVQEWTNDQIENGMEIVLDTVNKLRSLRPSTDTTKDKSIA